MKTVFNDPVGWARKAAGSRSRLIIMTTLSILLCAGISSPLISTPYSYTIFWIFFMGAFMPFLYLYCIYRLFLKQED